ncbi:MAG: TIGR00266 family protein [Clostridia bacterium]|nr:TIGR00266 family protein [Clostridia bacterium]
MRYQIQGEPLPVVVCEMDPGETMITEAGSMAWMSPNMDMQTTGGGVGKVFGRMFSGESMFQNRYTAQGGPGMIAFTSSFPGSIKAYQITPNAPIVVQKKAFLASEAGVELSVHFQQKASAGFFGGEGFIMQRLSGSGVAFIEVDGSTTEYTLAPGQQLVVSTGHVAMMDATVTMEARAIHGVKNVLFGGESFFNTVLTGPGRVLLQTMPMSKFVGEISRYLPKSN